MRARFGPSVANVATAHKLARIFYAILKSRQPYLDLGADAYDIQHKQRLLRNLTRKAHQLGLALVPLSPATSVDQSTVTAT